MERVLSLKKNLYTESTLYIDFFFKEKKFYIQKAHFLFTEKNNLCTFLCTKSVLFIYRTCSFHVKRICRNISLYNGVLNGVLNTVGCALQYIEHIVPIITVIIGTICSIYWDVLYSI